MILCVLLGSGELRRHVSCVQHSACTMLDVKLIQFYDFFIKCCCYLLLCDLFIHNLSLALGSLGADAELSLCVLRGLSSASYIKCAPRSPAYFCNTQVIVSSQPSSPLPSDPRRTERSVHVHLWWQQLCPPFLKRLAGLWTSWLLGYVQCDEGHAFLG